MRAEAGRRPADACCASEARRPFPVAVTLAGRAFAAETGARLGTALFAGVVTFAFARVRAFREPPVLSQAGGLTRAAALRGIGRLYQNVCADRASTWASSWQTRSWETVTAVRPRPLWTVAESGIGVRRHIWEAGNA